MNHPVDLVDFVNLTQRKISASRTIRGGIKLIDNLLLSSILKKAQDLPELQQNQCKMGFQHVDLHGTYVDYVGEESEELENLDCAHVKGLLEGLFISISKYTSLLGSLLFGIKTAIDKLEHFLNVIVGETEEMTGFEILALKVVDNLPGRIL